VQEHNSKKKSTTLGLYRKKGKGEKTLSKLKVREKRVRTKGMRAPGSMGGITFLNPARGRKGGENGKLQGHWKPT